jgi:hypothetical protein
MRVSVQQGRDFGLEAEPAERAATVLQTQWRP